MLGESPAAAWAAAALGVGASVLGAEASGAVTKAVVVSVADGEAVEDGFGSRLMSLASATVEGSAM